MDERNRRLTAAKARAVLVGKTAELSPDRCCPNCVAIRNAAVRPGVAPAARPRHYDRYGSVDAFVYGTVY